MYINSSKEINDKDPKFNDKVFVITKIKNTLPWKYIVNDLESEEIVGMFNEKE